MSILVILSLCMSSVSWAGTIFEPTATLSQGSFSGDITGGQTLTDGTSVQADFTSLGVGFRYGITRNYIQVTGVAEMFGVMSSNNAGLEDKEQFIGNFGVGVGYEWNIPLRTYLVLGFPFSSLEISYFITETFLLGVKATRMEAEVDGVDVNFNSYGLTLSIPFEFEYPSYWWRKRDWE